MVGTNKQKTKLTNLAGITLSGNWKIPDKGATGTIQNTDTGVNGYLSVNANTAAGSVVVEEALDKSDVGQHWKRIDNDEKDYLTLMNPNSGKFLTADNPPNTLTIEGTYLLLIREGKVERINRQPFLTTS